MIRKYVSYLCWLFTVLAFQVGAEEESWSWVPYSEQNPFKPGEGCSLEKEPVVCRGVSSDKILKLGIVIPSGKGCQLLPGGEIVSRFDAPSAKVVDYYLWNKPDTVDCNMSFGASSVPGETISSMKNCHEKRQILCRFKHDGKRQIGVLLTDLAICRSLNGLESTVFEVFQQAPRWNLNVGHWILVAVTVSFALLMSCSFIIEQL